MPAGSSAPSAVLDQPRDQRQATSPPGQARYGRQVTTLAHAWREFAHKPSGWFILAAVAIGLALRITLGGELGWRDALAAAAMLVIYPFGEWAIHVYILHAKPFEVRGRRLEMPSAREHRAHHRKPNDLTMILLGPKELVGLLFVAVPVTVAVIAALVALLPGPLPLGALISAAIAGYALIFVYEWVHFLIHTAYRPRSRYYRRIWRNHRLHHFKNEHFWHGITQTVSDRVLGTNPDQREIRRSSTARTLQTR
jgi:hypothetical protein